MIWDLSESPVWKFSRHRNYLTEALMRIVPLAPAGRVASCRETSQADAPQSVFAGGVSKVKDVGAPKPETVVDL
jgi:hypothetical protein